MMRYSPCRPSRNGRHGAVSRLLRIAACLAGCCALPPPAPGIPPEAFLDLVDQRWSQVHDFQCRFRQQQWVEGETAETACQGLIRSVSPDYVRIDFEIDEATDTTEPAHGKEVIVFDGESWYHYIQSSSTVTVGEDPPDDVLPSLMAVLGVMGMDRETFRRQFTLKPVLQETRHGVPCWRMEVISRGPDRRLRTRSTVWLREDDMLPVQFSYRSPLRQSDLEITQPLVNQGLREDDLRLRVPRGSVRVFQR